MGTPSEQVTEILETLGQGNQAASEQLLPLVYDELRLIGAHPVKEDARRHSFGTAAKRVLVDTR